MVTGRVLPSILEDHARQWRGLDFLEQNDKDRLLILSQFSGRSPKNQLRYLLRMAYMRHSVKYDGRD